MKKYITLCIALIFGAAFATQLKAQCSGGRYHDAIFTGTPTVTSNIVYGSNLDQNGATVSLKLDVYQPACDTATNRPLIVFAHGGGFVAGDKSDASYVLLAQGLAQMGYVVASINYRLGFPTSGAAAQYGFNSAIMRGLHDGRAAVRFMRDKALNGGNPYKTNPNKIIFSGASAGAIIALHLAYENTSAEMNMNCGGQPGTNSTSIQGNSNSLTCASTVIAIVAVSGGIRDLSWIQTNDIPVYLAHGTNDGTVPYGSGSFGGFFPIEGSKTINTKCNSTGTVHCFTPMYGQDHVPSNPAYNDTVATISRNFMEKILCNITLNCNYTTSPAHIGPAVTIALTSGTNPVCAGTSVTFTATPTNAGATPTYQWKVGTTNVGTNSNTFTSTTLATGSVVTCTITPACGAAATSPGITLTVTPLPTITQSGNVLTSSATTGNQWYLNGTIITGATGHTYTVTQIGSYTVIVGGCTSLPTSVTTTGVIDNSGNDFSFTTYPNPNNGTFNLSFNSPTKENFKLEMTNVLGASVYQEILPEFIGQYSKQIDIGKYGKGNYLIRLSNSKNEVVKKIIVD